VDLDGPTLTDLITSSGIGPLRGLVHLRQRQEEDLADKETELEDLRINHTTMTEQVSRLEEELQAANVKFQSAPTVTNHDSSPETTYLRAANRSLKEKIKAQASTITSLLAQCAKLKKSTRTAAEGNKKGKTSSTSPKTISTPSISAERCPPVPLSVRVGLPSITEPTLTSVITAPKIIHITSQIAGQQSLPGVGKELKKNARAAEWKKMSEELEQEKTRGREAAATSKSAKMANTIRVRLDGKLDAQQASEQSHQHPINESGFITGISKVRACNSPNIRPPWPQAESSMSLGTSERSIDYNFPSSSKSKQISTGPRCQLSYMKAVSARSALPEIPVRGRGQIVVLEGNDGSSELRMEAYNVSLRANGQKTGMKQMAGKGRKSGRMCDQVDRMK